MPSLSLVDIAAEPLVHCRRAKLVPMSLTAALRKGASSIPQSTSSSSKTRIPVFQSRISSCSAHHTNVFRLPMFCVVFERMQGHAEPCKVCSAPADESLRHILPEMGGARDISEQQGSREQGSFLHLSEIMKSMVTSQAFHVFKSHASHRSIINIGSFPTPSYFSLQLSLFTKCYT